MADALTNNFSFTLQVTGSNAGVWGTDVNANVITPLDSILGGTFPVTMTSSNVTLTNAQWVSGCAFKITGALTANLQLILPLSPNSVGAATAVGGKFIVDNETTGAHTITVLTAATGSTGVTIGQGGRTNLYSDTVNVWYDNDAAAGKLTTTGGANPNGNVAGTAASINTNASVAWDGANLWVCTTSGNAASAVWTAITGGVPPPQGYLSVSDNNLAPIISGDAIGATAVFYLNYVGNLIPIFTGSVFGLFQSGNLGLNLSAGSQASNGLYDIFCFLNGGAPTLAFGPSWAASGGNQVAGSCARGTGAGSTALARQNGLWVNANALSAANNGASTFAIPQFQGTYLGTVYIDASAGQVTCHRSYGQSRKFGVWNAYNRVPITLQGGDPTANWSRAVGGVRVSNGNTANNLIVLCGLAEEQIACSFNQYGGGSNTNGTIGIGWNNSGAQSGTLGQVGTNNNANSSMLAQFDQVPSIGINAVYATEAYISGGAFTWNGTQANMLLRAQWRG